MGRSPVFGSVDPLLSFVAMAVVATAAMAEPVTIVPYAVVGDAIPNSLTGERGDLARGRAIVVDRQTGLCLLCHSGPFPEQRFQGNLAPDLTDAGSRLSEGQLRLRLVDSRRLSSATIMPPYYATGGLTRVGRNWSGKPVLNAGQVEDVVAFLATLKEVP